MFAVLTACSLPVYVLLTSSSNPLDEYLLHLLELQFAFSVFATTSRFASSDLFFPVDEAMSMSW